jgi:hypothetical protein
MATDIGLRVSELFIGADARIPIRLHARLDKGTGSNLPGGRR